MRRKIHVTDGTPDGTGDTIVEDNLNQEATGSNAPPVDDTLQDDPAPAPAEATASTSAEMEKLRAEVERLTNERDAEREQRLRTLADFQNFRRRKEEERGADRQFANRELIIGLLPVLDNFERALAAAEKTRSYDALVDGVRLTLRQLNDFLAKNGVNPIESLGKEFDPNFHEAVMRVEDGGHPENSVVEELQRGYVMHDRVLRPSMVKVAGNG
jgi:molecular chaperone GrpE